MSVLSCRLKIWISIVLFFWVLIPHVLEANPDDSIQLSRGSQRFSANFEHTPLIKVMQQLADEFGITVTMTGVSKEIVISSTFVAQPLEKAIGQLLLGQDYALLYDIEKLSDGVTQKKQLREIIVLPRQSSGTAKAPKHTTPTVLTSRNNGQKFIDDTKNDSGNNTTRLLSTPILTTQSKTLIEGFHRELNFSKLTKHYSQKPVEQEEKFRKTEHLEEDREEHLIEQLLLAVKSLDSNSQETD